MSARTRDSGTRTGRTRNLARDPRNAPTSGDYEGFEGEPEVDGSRGEGMRRSELIQLLREIESESSRQHGVLSERDRGPLREARRLGEDSIVGQLLAGPAGDVELGLDPNASNKVCFPLDSVVEIDGRG